MKRLILSLFLFYSICALGQVNENFSDGDFTVNPVWYGEQSNWTVANSRLQSGSDVSNSIFYLSTFNGLSDTAEWNFNINLDFNPSGLNYVDVYLTASDTNLNSVQLVGYFVRIGNTDDEVSLYRKDVGGSVEMIDGMNGLLNGSSHSIRINVIKRDTASWELNAAVNGGVLLRQGATVDSSYHQSVAFGFLVRQSTASFFRRHYFDDIRVCRYLPDTIPPTLDSVWMIDSNRLELYFNEPIDTIPANNALNYELDQNIGHPDRVVFDNLTPQKITLVFSSAFPERVPLQLRVFGLDDLHNNLIDTIVKTFVNYVPYPYDLVIDEIMADPDPPLFFPAEEWIEIHNASPFDINLKDWKLIKSGVSTGLFPSYKLRPDSSVVVCSTGSLAELLPFTPALSVTGFPTLSNSGDQITLFSPEGKTIHTVSYSDTWYDNALKKMGGWSLEMIDPQNPCSGSSNWTASVSYQGSTPGKLNSVDELNPDETAPVLTHAYAPDSVTIVLCFNESVDSTRAFNNQLYVVSNGVGYPSSVQVVNPDFNRVVLRLSRPLITGVLYTIESGSVCDCAHNESGKTRVQVGLKETPAPKDMLINEVLFNPPTEGADYFELYNNSNKTIDISTIFIANRNSQNNIDNITRLSSEPRLLFPGSYFVFTTDPAYLNKAFWVQDPEAIIKTESLPSFNDDEGFVVLLGSNGDILDELHYDDDWHDELLYSEEGVALERISATLQTQSSENWHSASTTSGYGTPGYRNSQQLMNIGTSVLISVYPDHLSPDNDGRDDFLTIRYQFKQPGNYLNSALYDLGGRLICYLAQQVLCGTMGDIIWKGKKADGKAIIPGMYIVYTEVADTRRGNIQKFKKPILIR